MLEHELYVREKLTGARKPEGRAVSRGPVLLAVVGRLGSVIRVIGERMEAAGGAEEQRRRRRTRQLRLRLRPGSGSGAEEEGSALP